MGDNMLVGVTGTTKVFPSNVGTNPVASGHSSNASSSSTTPRGAEKDGVSINKRLGSQPTLVLYQTAKEREMGEDHRLESNDEILIQKGESMFNLVVQNAKHTIWVTMMLFPLYLLSSLGIILALWAISKVEQGSYKYSVAMVGVSISFICGPLMATLSVYGFIRASIGSFFTLIVFVVLEYLLAEYVFPHPSIVFLSGTTSLVGIFVAYSYVIGPRLWLIHILLGGLMGSTLMIGAYYIYLISTVQMSTFEEVMVTGFGYYILVMVLGRVLFADFMKFVLEKLFSFSKSRTEAIIGFTFFAKISFSMPQTYALLELEDGFFYSVLVSNLLELVLVTCNIVLFRKGIAKFRTRLGGSVTASWKLKSSDTVSNPNKALIYDWMMDFMEYSDPKLAYLMYGEELGDRLNSIVVSVGYIFHQLWSDNPQDVQTRAIYRCILMVVIEIAEDIIKAQIVMFFSGIAFFKVPKQRVSFKVGYMAAMHGITVFCIITLGRILANQWKLDNAEP